jgi:hypothetical protein
MIHQFGFQGMEKALHRRMLASLTLTGSQQFPLRLMLGEPLLVGTGGILAAAIGVVHQARQRPAPLERHVQGRPRQLLRHLLVHRPANHLAGEEVEHDGQVQPALAV